MDIANPDPASSASRLLSEARSARTASITNAGAGSIVASSINCRATSDGTSTSARLLNGPNTATRCPRPSVSVSFFFRATGSPPLRLTTRHRHGRRLRRSAITRRMLRPHIPRAVRIVMPKIPRLAGQDRLQAPGARDAAARDLRRPPLAQLLMRRPVAALGRCQPRVGPRPASLALQPGLFAVLRAVAMPPRNRPLPAPLAPRRPASHLLARRPTTRRRCYITRRACGPIFD